LDCSKSIPVQGSILAFLKMGPKKMSTNAAHGVILRATHRVLAASVFSAKQSAASVRSAKQAATELYLAASELNAELVPMFVRRVGGQHGFAEQAPGE
jgi:hypothetical protein